MRHVRFTVEEDFEFGSIGIVPNIFKNWESYNPTQNPGHDLIDHTTKETGEVWQEFRALGANLFVHSFHRDRTFKFYSENHVKNIGFEMTSSVSSTLEDAIRFDNLNAIPMPPKAKLTKGENDTFKFFFHHLAIKIEAEHEEGEDFDSTAFDFWVENKEKIEGWFKVGYANAKRRYKGECYYAMDMKVRLDRLVTSKMEVLKDYVGTGEEFTLSFDIEEQFATISHRYGLI